MGKKFYDMRSKVNDLLKLVEDPKIPEYKSKANTDLPQIISNPETANHVNKDPNQLTPLDAPCGAGVELNKKYTSTIGLEPNYWEKLARSKHTRSSGLREIPQDACMLPCETYGPDGFMYDANEYHNLMTPPIEVCPSRWNTSLPNCMDTFNSVKEAVQKNFYQHQGMLASKFNNGTVGPDITKDLTNKISFNDQYAGGAEKARFMAKCQLYENKNPVYDQKQNATMEQNFSSANMNGNMGCNMGGNMGGMDGMDGMGGLYNTSKVAQNMQPQKETFSPSCDASIINYLNQQEKDIISDMNSVCYEHSTENPVQNIDNIMNHNKKMTKMSHTSDKLAPILKQAPPEINFALDGTDSRCSDPTKPTFAKIY